MTIQQTDTYWLDAAGNRIRLANISEADQMKDEVTRRLVAGAKSVQSVMAEFKRTALDEALAAKALIFDKYQVKMGGKKGNFWLKSFDGTQEVQVAVADQIGFGVELQAAKALIDECIEGWSPGANDNIITMVEFAFQVNKTGRIDTGRVLGLRRLSMKGPDGQPDLRWKRAMDAVSDAIVVTGTATYIRFYDRADGGAVTLDFSKL
ncbi:MAG: DUF3164 family protein [Paracoccus sp. (in: a-proteobacteria)]|nr:DUF3164 family protein [Paracoccus sp. (in: a-proteobacteria)]